MPVLTLWKLDKEGESPQIVGGLSFVEGNSFAEFRDTLQTLKMFEFQFDFWDSRLESRMHHLLERANKIIDYDNKVTVIPVRESGLIQHITSLSTVVTQSMTSVGSGASIEQSNEHIERIDVDVSKTDIENSKNNVNNNVSGFEGASVEPSQNISSALESEHVFNSTLISKEILDLWKKNISKLEVHMNEMKYCNHHWRVKTWDENDKAHGRLECLECDVNLEGISKGVMDKATVNNCFTNYKTKHIKSKKHHTNWCRKRQLPVKEDELKAMVKDSVLDDRALVNLGLKVMERVNEEEPGDKKSFVLVGDLEREPFYTFYYRVSCVHCNNDMALVPPQRNLEHNLREHLASPKHLAAVKFHQGRTEGIPLLSGRPGRPSKVDKRDVRQKTIHKYFGHDQGKSSETLQNTIQEGTSTGQKHKGINDVDLALSQLCWGLWEDVIVYNGKERLIKSLLDDQLAGSDWWPEAHIVVDVFNYTSGMVVEIYGLFRHKDCHRVSRLGSGFENLTCEACCKIKMQTDFRLRIFREEQAVEKRGNRTTGSGRRLTYLTSAEIITQARSYCRLRNVEKHRTKRFQARICMLQTKIPSLKDVVSEAANRKDIVKFCSAIVIAHRRGAFGGRSALWDLLNDIVLNLNRSVNGKRFSKGTKVICQALFQHGGRRVVDCLSMNLIGPSLNTLQKDRRGMLQFQTGFHEKQFQFVAHVYSILKARLGIIVDVPCLIAEDETTVKRSVRWIQKTDSLIGFCGPKNNHSCTLGLEIKVGNGECGFQNVLGAFEEQCIGSLARVMIVNPLHAEFPRLCILVTAVCNRFDHLWVRMQWDTILAMWSVHCRDLVGPLIGHASDGDVRRRKLMLQDYNGGGLSRPRQFLQWEGWSLSHSYINGDAQFGDAYGLHDQDFIHVGKKLINPLDSVTKVLHVGSEIATLEHLSLIYELYKHEDHGLNHEDILRTDRQNWSSAQRLCSRKVLNCLKMLRERKDARVEMTLGTELYLTICSNYIDIFLNVRLDLRSRIVLCAKVSFFFRLWKVWLQKGNHEVGGNTQVLSLKGSFISLESFYDIQMSCHFVVLLIVLFRDRYPSMSVPFHLTGSDCCEQFFSKVGGMKGHEQNYDFAELIDAATATNRLAELELTDGVISVGKSHKKHKNIWMKIHPLESSEQIANLLDYSKILTNLEVVNALKEGLVEAQEFCTRLQMCPRIAALSSDQQWFKCPWEFDNLGTNVAELFGVVLEDEVEIPIAGDILQEDVEVSIAEEIYPLDNPSLPNEVGGEVSSEFDDQVSDDIVVSEEIRHTFGELFSDLIDCPPESGHVIVDPTVSFEGKRIYKSTLVSQLVGNPTLSKDRLMKVKQSIYFNNLVDKPKDRLGARSILLGLGSDCGVYFLEDVVEPRSRAKKRVVNKVSRPTAITQNRNCKKGTWWIGRVQKIRKKYNGRWGRSREPVDLLDRPLCAVFDGCACQILCNWFTPTSTRLKFKYTMVDPQWIDLDTVISTVTMTVRPNQPTIFILDSNDAKCMDEFVKQTK